MSRRAFGVRGDSSQDGSEPEDYGRILEEFNDFGGSTDSKRDSKQPRRHSADHSRSSRDSRPKETSSPKARSSRRLHAGTSSGNKAASSPRLASPKVLNRTTFVLGSSARSKGNRPDLTAPFVDSDDTATDDDLPPVENDGSNCKVDFSVRNRALLQENRRLQELVDEYEQKLRVGGREDIAKTSQHTEKTSNTKSTSVAIGEDEDDDTAEDSVYKLKGKIKALKAKRRSEKLNLLQMQKNVDTHTAEIAGLQRELNRALTELEELQQERVGDKNKIRELMKQLNAGRRHVTDDTDNNIVKQLKQDLQKRDGELEVTLELLQSKVERIMQLEFELEKGKEKLQKTERRVEDLIKRNSVPGTEGQSFQSVELISAEAEIKSLRRQNMMLKLVVEELQEARRRRSDSDIDIDSVFLKLPPEMQEEIPHSVGLLGSLCLPDEEMSVGTDLLSVGANQLPKPDPRVT